MLLGAHHFLMARDPASGIFHSNVEPASAEAQATSLPSLASNIRGLSERECLSLALSY